MNEETIDHRANELINAVADVLYECPDSGGRGGGGDGWPLPKNFFLPASGRP